MRPSPRTKGKHKHLHRLSYLFNIKMSFILNVTKRHKQKKSIKQQILMLLYIRVKLQRVFVRCFFDAFQAKASC